MKQNDIYEMVTSRILEMMEQGIIPWHKPWTGTAGAWSRATGKAYSLLNQWMMPQGEYATFNQVRKEGGRVNKGAKGYPVVFYKPQMIEETNQDTGEVTKKFIPLLKYFVVFNVAEQTNLEQKYHTEDIQKNNEPLETLEQIKDDYINREGLTFRSIRTDKACYSPAEDTVTVPLLEQFDDTPEYYSTVFHELAHSTGHSSRLNRINKIACFGSDDYGKEELIAEITASAVMNEAGIETEQTFKNSTAYIQNWAEAIKADHKLIVHASSKAQKSFERIMGL